MDHDAAATNATANATTISLFINAPFRDGMSTSVSEWSDAAGRSHALGGQLRGVPGGDAPRQLADGAEPLALQQARGDRGPVSACAEHDQMPVARQFRRVL